MSEVQIQTIFRFRYFDSTDLAKALFTDALSKDRYCAILVILRMLFLMKSLYKLELHSRKVVH